MSLGPIEIALTIYTVVTFYWSLLGAYVLVKTNVISPRVAPLIVGYSTFAWAVSRIMYINFPEIPPHPILILSGLVDSPQGILTTIYVYVRTKIISLKWMSYIICYLFFLAVSRVVLYLYRNLPVPEILVLPAILAGWAVYPWWFYVYVKANKIFSLKVAFILIGYQVFAWAGSIFMLYYLRLPYSTISAAQTLLDYPSTILTLIFIDRYRLKEVHPVNETRG